MQLIENKITREHQVQLESPSTVYNSSYRRQMKLWIWLLVILVIALFFLPWTQNIRATGTVTTLYQQQRPQELNAIIPGRIVKWYVREGNYVQQGDTIVQLADVKDDYLDSNLVLRTEEQLEAKRQSIDFYNKKVAATGNQITAMQAQQDLKIASLRNKIQQLQRKVQSDSAEWAAAKIDANIATVQYERAKQMLDDGIISLVDFERRTANYQKALASLTEKWNKYQNTIQELAIAQIDIGTVQQETADKVSKARGEQAGAQSDIATTMGEVAKLQNQVQNYRIRGSQRWLIAPQDGQIVSAVKAGLNEIVKEGEMIVQVIPTHVDYAVEMYVYPMDLVLIDTGQRVRLTFDGFPAIVFSGWPSASYGVFTGKVIAVETNVATNGKFRVLVVEDERERNWPAELRMGTGAIGFALLKDVPIWYELWRRINGFPPEYYKSSTPIKETKS